MADGREPSRLHPDDLAAIVQAMQAGPIRLPPPPSDVPTGLDARVISEAVRAIVGEKTAVYLTREQIVALIIDTVSRGGLEIDDAHRDETRAAMEATIKWHRRVDKAIAGISVTIITAIIVGFLRLLGFHIPFPTTEGGGG